MYIHIYIYVCICGMNWYNIYIYHIIIYIYMDVVQRVSMVDWLVPSKPLPETDLPWKVVVNQELIHHIYRSSYLCVYSMYIYINIYDMRK